MIYDQRVGHGSSLLMSNTYFRGPVGARKLVGDGLWHVSQAKQPRINEKREIPPQK